MPWRIAFVPLVVTPVPTAIQPGISPYQRLKFGFIAMLHPLPPEPSKAVPKILPLASGSPDPYDHGVELTHVTPLSTEINAGVAALF